MHAAASNPNAATSTTAHRRRAWTPRFADRRTCIAGPPDVVSKQKHRLVPATRLIMGAAWVLDQVAGVPLTLDVVFKPHSRSGGSAMAKGQGGRVPAPRPG